MIPFGIINRPTEIVTRRKQSHVRGSIVELFQYIRGLEPHQCIEVRSDVLSTSNIMSLYQEAKRQGYKLHCVCDGNKRLLWSEKHV